MGCFIILRQPFNLAANLWVFADTTRIISHFPDVFPIFVKSGKKSGKKARFFLNRFLNLNFRKKLGKTKSITEMFYHEIAAKVQ